MLQFTGERVIPELMKPTNALLLEHTARYYFSTPYVKGRVLDIPDAKSKWDPNYIYTIWTRTR
jgi:hypothetical protein